MSPGFGFLVCSAIGTLVGDVFITREEIEGLMADLLYVESPPAGATSLTEWVREHRPNWGGNTQMSLRDGDLRKTVRTAGFFMHACKCRLSRKDRSLP